MAQDDYNYNNDQQGPYKPSQQEWDKAANLLNSYKDQNGGGNIDWEKARGVFEQNAANGGSFNDWVSATQGAKDSWLTPQQQSQPQGYQAPQSPAGAWNRQQFRDASMGRQVGMTAADFIAQNPQFSQGVRLVPGSNDKVILPTGEVMDLSINANAQGQGTANGWTGVGQWNGSSIVPYADAGGGAGAGAGAAGAGGSSSFSASSETTNPAMQALIERLTKRADQSLNFDPNDPVIRGQVDAYRAEQDRAARNHLADLAESAGPLANLQGEQRLAAERVGQNVSGYQADLASRDLTAKRQEISDALSTMGGLLTEQQRMNLQMQLASMDDAIKRMQLEQQGQQFNADLGFRNAQLGEQSRQFNNTQGLQYDQLDWARSPLNPNNMVVG